MQYPKLGERAKVAFLLALDVEYGKNGEWCIAETHYGTGLSQFGEPWIHGVHAVLEKGLAEKLVIVGGVEQRYPDESTPRPNIIKHILTKGGADPERIECLLSQPNTVGNAIAIREWLDLNSRFVGDDYIVVCAYWHVARASLDLYGQHINAPIFPAEAVMLASADREDQEAERFLLCRDLRSAWGGSALAERAVAECNGIADKLTGRYQSLCDKYRPLVTAE